VVVFTTSAELEAWLVTLAANAKSTSAILAQAGQPSTPPTPSSLRPGAHDPYPTRAHPGWLFNVSVHRVPFISPSQLTYGKPTKRCGHEMWLCTLGRS
jgi:hypothetical protein